VGIVLSPAGAPVRRALAGRVMRLRGAVGADPVAEFRRAPCYEQDADERRRLRDAEVVP
jgi:hypothetical protein